MTAALIRTGVARVAVRANWGRWVIDCPRCPDALSEKQPGNEVLSCWACGQAYEPVWPTDEMRLGVERLLMLRPDPKNRNWVPGETLHDLLEENITHGIGPTEVGQSIQILGDQIVMDTLPAPLVARALGA